MLQTQTQQPAARQLLNNDEAAAYLGLSHRTLPVWRVQGKGPRFIKIGHLVRYELLDLNAWIDANTRASTSAAQAN